MFFLHVQRRVAASNKCDARFLREIHRERAVDFINFVSDRFGRDEAYPKLRNVDPLQEGSRESMCDVIFEIDQSYLMDFVVMKKQRFSENNSDISIFFGYILLGIKLKKKKLLRVYK